MFEHVILEFKDKKEKIELDNIADYDGDEDITKLHGLETVVDCRELTLSFLGEMFPELEKLRLNNSIMTSIRDIGCTLKNLRFLNLARCGLTSLDGLGALSGNLEELYVAYNKITEVCDLLGMEKLKIVDLEANLIENLDEVEILKTSPKITALTLAGNPAANVPNYRERVAELLPNLVYLDEKRLKPKVKVQKTPRGMEKSQSMELKKPQTVKFSDDINMNESPKPFTKMKSLEVFNLEKVPSDQIIEEVDESATTDTSDSKKSDEEEKAPITLASLSNMGEEVLMTEQIRDRVDERPISSLGTKSDEAFFGFFKRSADKIPTPKSSLSQSLNKKQKIVRPISAKGRSFV